MSSENERLTKVEKQIEEMGDVVLLFEDQKTQHQETLQRQEELFRNIQTEANDEMTESTEKNNQRLNVVARVLGLEKVDNLDQSPILTNLTSDIETLQLEFEEEENQRDSTNAGHITRIEALNQRLNIVELRLTNVRRGINNLASGIKFLLRFNENTNTDEYRRLSEIFSINRDGGGKRKKNKRKKTRKKRGKKTRKKNKTRKLGGFW